MAWRLTIGYTGAYDVVTISDLVGRVMVKSVAQPKETVVNIGNKRLQAFITSL